MFKGPTLLSTLWDAFVKPLGPRELCRRGGGKILRARGGGPLHGNSVFQTQQDGCAHECTETGAAHTGPAQVHGGWGPSPDEGGGYGLPPPIKNLFANDT